MDPSLLELVSSFLGGSNANSSNTEESRLAPCLIESNDTSTSKTTAGAAEYQEPAGYETGYIPELHVIIFTKDRPWQLQQLLRSMGESDAEVSIIGNVQQEFEDGYQQVRNEYITCNFLEESQDHPFHDILMKLTNAHRRNEKVHWMFLTDDCLFLKPIRDVMDLVSAADVCLARLHPGITWCQTRDIPSPPPYSQLRYCGQSNSLMYPLAYGQVEWAYPWDLSGGIYRNNLVQEILNQLDEEALSHPNKLEPAGYSLLRKRKGLTICVPSSPTLLILTINRVQKICKAPVAHTVDPSTLLVYLQNGRMLDLDRYRAFHFNSAHISELLFEEKGPSSFDISVIMPVQTGPPEFARHAMRSIVLQLKDQSVIRKMQIVVVDDRCIDGSIDAIVASAIETGNELNQKLVVVDHRNNQAHDEDTADLVLDLFASEKPGVASALNLGLSHARFDFVARMDADDISTPGRFVRQLQYLEENPSIAALGTHSVLFSEDNTAVVASNKSLAHHLPVCAISGTWTTRLALPPADSGFAFWSMLFSCCLSHPSVVYRKRMIQDIGRYKEDICHAEDYDLWLRLTQKNPLTVASLPFIGLWHRKHRACSKKSERQTLEAQHLSFRAIKLLVPEVEEGTAQHLVCPDTAESLCQLDSAGTTLVRLRDNFMRTHVQTLGKRDVALVEYDFKQRLAEIATVSVTKFGDQTTTVWKLWCHHCPEMALQQIALLCHTQRNSALY